MGWDGTGINCYGMGWDRKICPMDKPANLHAKNIAYMLSLLIYLQYVKLGNLTNIGYPLGCRIPLAVREVKSDTVSPTTRHRCDVSLGAV